MKDTRTISMQGSEQLSWDDVDEYAQKHGFTTTSGFTQYALEKEILGVKTKIKDKLTYIMVLLLMALTFMTFSLILR